MRWDNSKKNQHVYFGEKEGEANSALESLLVAML